MSSVDASIFDDAGGAYELHCFQSSDSSEYQVSVLSGGS